MKKIVLSLALLLLMPIWGLQNHAQVRAQGLNDAALTEYFAVTQDFAIVVFDTRPEGIVVYQQNNLPFYCAHKVSLKDDSPSKKSFNFSGKTYTDGYYIWSENDENVLDVMQNSVIEKSLWSVENPELANMTSDRIIKLHYDYIKGDFEKLQIDPFDPRDASCGLMEIQIPYCLICCFGFLALLIITLIAALLFRKALQDKAK